MATDSTYFENSLQLDISEEEVLPYVFLYSRLFTHMRQRMAALTFALIVAASCFAPFLVSEDSDAISTEDYTISVPFHQVTNLIPRIVGNGESTTYSVYITNNSEHVLDVAFSGESNVTYLTWDPLEPITLMPAGDPKNGDFVKVTVTIHVDEVIPSLKGGMFFLTVSIADVEDSTFTISPVTFAIDVNSKLDTSGSYNKFFGVIPNTLQDPFSTPVIPFLVSILTVFLLGLFIGRILIPLFARYIDEDKKRYSGVLSLAAPIIAVLLYLGNALEIVSTDLNLIVDLEKIATAVFIMLLAMVGWKIYVLIVKTSLTRLGKVQDSPLDLSFLPIFTMLGKIVLWVGSISAILHVFGFDLTAILMSAGIITLGITLGAQNVLSQLFNGISLLLTRPFREGDYLMINNETYKVVRIRLMNTELTNTYNDRIISFPNNVLASQTIVNMSKNDRTFTMKILFQIPYGDDMDQVEKVVIDMANKSKYLVHDGKYGKPEVKLMEFKNTGLEMSLEATVVDFSYADNILSDMKKELYIALAEAGIQMPYEKLRVGRLDEDGSSPRDG
ncbi:MAG: mechanosensitive ion channel family protein [Thermoplasmata archaeon]|nr:mechanosensitive ion channel family protein [Thermoplasmata archaeon]